MHLKSVQVAQLFGGGKKNRSYFFARHCVSPAFLLLVLKETERTAMQVTASDNSEDCVWN